MESIKMNVKTLATYMDMSVRELGIQSGVGENHILGILSQKATMTAEDLVMLSEFTGVPKDNIEYRKEKQ